jgi:RNA polymerase sigma-70 factor (ECF subfamily)
VGKPEKQQGRYTDEQIVGKVREGEIELFREIVLRYQRRIFGIGMRFHRNRDDAYDFTQEVLIKAYNHLPSYRGESRFYSWLIRIAYNHGINAVKSGRPCVSLAEDYLHSPEDGPEAIHVREEIRAALSRAVQELPERYRICVDLFFFFGLSYPEIAGITGFPVNTIKSHVFRAKQLLKDALRGTAAEEEYDEM